MGTTNKPQLGPQEQIIAASNAFRLALSQSAGSQSDILTPALQGHIAKAMAAILTKTIQLSVASPSINPGTRTEQYNVDWELMEQGATSGGGMGGGFGGGTPDNSPYQNMRRAPDRYDVVEDVDREFPGLIFYDPAEFTRIVATRLNKIDPRFGMKSRRGGPISDDTIGYDVGMPGYVEAIDIIVGAGTINPRAGWSSYGVVSGEWWRP
jgi:hypothetical protein